MLYFKPPQVMVTTTTPHGEATTPHSWVGNTLPTTPHSRTTPKSEDRDSTSRRRQNTVRKNSGGSPTLRDFENFTPLTKSQNKKPPSFGYPIHHYIERNANKTYMLIPLTTRCQLRKAKRASPQRKNQSADPDAAIIT